MHDHKIALLNQGISESGVADLMKICSSFDQVRRINKTNSDKDFCEFFEAKFFDAFNELSENAGT